ncbi:MAG TPA: heme-binding protein [Acidimicrobiales bacterium]|nr:heme-binding protein [Acidimicrobiales bacterium]
MIELKTLSLEDANRVIQAVSAAALEANPRMWPGLGIVVVDKYGQIIAAARMDGMAPRFFHAAHRKAYTAAVMERDTAGVIEFWNRQEKEGHRGPHDWNDPMLTTLPGGYVVRHGSQILGGIGVAGGTTSPHGDDDFAEIAISALGEGFRHTPNWEPKVPGD